MKKTITMNFQMSTVVEGKTTEEMLEKAKNQILEQMKEKFPGFTYSISEGDALTMATVNAGDIVEECDTGTKWIVVKVNKKTITIVNKGGVCMQGAASLFRASDASFDEVRHVRTAINVTDVTEKSNPKTSEVILNWDIGDSGYATIGKEVQKVIVSAVRNEKYTLTLINDGRYVNVTQRQMEHCFKDKM